jgi:hypothetical protein
MAIDVTTIPSADWSPKLGSIGEVVEGLDDVAQCIQIILTTPKGSVPHRPTFGADIWRYLDLPVNLAMPNMIMEASNAITLWEPRAKLVKVTATPDLSDVVLAVEWEAALQGTQTTQVRYALVQPS